MTYEQVMQELKRLGTAQNVKVYKRYGAGDNLFGVSFANLGKLKKKIKTNHALAEKLWASGNTDAQTLATMVADPAQASEPLLDRWVRDTNYYCLIDVFIRYLASQTPFVQKKMEEWTKSHDEWVGRAGWDLLGLQAMQNGDLPDSYFEPFLARIERAIHRSKNRTREAMNGALIAIGMRSPSLQKQALAAARRIGRVEVDHGETGCKTPDAATDIQKTWARKKRKK
jgi:3-methyladenine DNA glycosylase AlkD